MTYLLEIKNNEIILVKDNDVLNKLYFLECRPLTISDIQLFKNKKNKKEINEYLVSDTPENLVKHTKEYISKIEHSIPLYDIYTENIYIIGKHNVYSRVVHQSYRFPEKELLDEIQNKLNEVNNKNIDVTDKLFLRKINKLKLMTEFMNYFDNGILFDTYMKVFYKYSQYVGKEMTICVNPSFVPQFYHLVPYFTRSEIINFAMNMGMTNVEEENLSNLCKIVTKQQINSNILLEHYKYIQDNQLFGFAQYYTLQGSFFINQYLRNTTNTRFKNEYLESLIKPMWNLVANAPPFDKQYTIYRFIQEDSYISHLEIGDIHTENGFMSTTRDPFYRSDLYKFGFILIKINIPADRRGVALCVETVSHFPEEQEIIFPPNAKFKLIKRDEDCVYYHTDVSFSSKVKTRYEFDWVGNGDMTFTRTKIPNIQTVDFLTITKKQAITLSEKIKYFEDNYVNEIFQFNVNLGGKEFTLVTESYDSTTAYKHYYAMDTKNGYSIYTIYKGHILFFIELGETDKGKEMHINYYVKYSSADTSKMIGDDNLIKFFSSIAHYFDIPSVVLYANYLNCDVNIIDSYETRLKQRGFSENKNVNQVNDRVKNNNDNTNTNDNNSKVLFKGSYCKDIYQYISTGIKRYSDMNVLNVELQPKFSYHDIDSLKKISPSKILKKDDRDELYQLYNKSYKGIDTITKFYEWIKENKCYLLDHYVVKIDRIMQKNNPFRNDMYMLDPITYLYNRRLINTCPTNMEIGITIKRNILTENKNDYRI